MTHHPTTPLIQLWCKAEERVRQYLISLNSSQGADIGGLYVQQERYLSDLAMIDARLRELLVDETMADSDDENVKNEVRDWLVDWLIDWC